MTDTGATASPILRAAMEAAEAIAAYAGEVDECGQFPIDSLKELKDRGLMSVLVPESFGGYGASMKTVASIAQILASRCLNTGVIWSMHCQQVAIVAHHALEPLREELLHRLVKDQLYIASITTEIGNGGNIFASQSPLIKLKDSWLLKRKAPIVTGGQYGDLFLIYMSGNSISKDNDVVVALVEREQAQLTYTSAWDSMGMRGTGSVGMEITAEIQDRQIIRSVMGFKEIALRTVVPVGHIALSASWLGAAKGVFDRLVAIIRKPANRVKFSISTDMIFEKLGRIRLKLDTVGSLLHEMIRRYDDGHRESMKTHSFNILMNNLKVAASEMLYEAVDDMMNLAGVRYGYTKNDIIPLERTLRDIKAARLMYRNDLLLIANGKMSLFEKTTI